MTDYLQLSFGSYGGAAAAAIWLLLRRRPIEQHLLHIKLLSSALCVLELKRARVRARERISRRGWLEWSAGGPWAKSMPRALQNC